MGVVVSGVLLNQAGFTSESLPLQIVISLRTLRVLL